MLKTVTVVASIAVLVLACGCAPTSFKITPVPLDRRLKEIELMRDPGWVVDKIAVIDVSGVLMNRPAGGFLSRGEHPVSFMVEKLEAARRDRAVKAVVLRINTPGGTVTASEIMYEEVMRFRESGKAVVAMMMDVAASGGFLIACGCDEIMAHPTSVTGSIGVVMQTVNVAGTLSKLGVSMDAIKSGPKKDAGTPFRPMSPEERAIFQQIIDEMHVRFIDKVERGRPNLSREQILELADGRVYTARQALAAGLIDRVGTLREAIDRAKELAEVTKCRVVTYQRPFGWHPNIYSQGPPMGEHTPRTINVINIDWPSWLRPGEVRFMYLWVPN